MGRLYTGGNSVRRRAPGCSTSSKEASEKANSESNDDLPERGKGGVVDNEVGTKSDEEAVLGEGLDGVSGSACDAEGEAMGTGIVRTGRGWARGK